MKVLFISQDGITDHIGKSQVAPYLLGLSTCGYEITVLSNEKDISSHDVSEYRSIFEQSNIKWFINSYSNKVPIFSPFLTSFRQYLFAKKICSETSFDLIHSRCYVSTIIGYFLKKSIGNIKLLFDLRDFWIDTRIETRKLGFLYRSLKIIEGNLFRNSDYFVCLTERAKNRILLMCSDFSCSSKVKVIPCCADLTLFDSNKIDDLEARKIRRKEGLENSFVLSYLGSIGPDYLLERMIETFKILKSLRVNSKFLFISNNGKEQVLKAFENQGLSKEDLIFKTLIRTDVPKYLNLIDLSLIYIRPSKSKIGCSPTKLAELLGMGVPILANSGVGDLNEILSMEANNSICLNSFSTRDVRESLAQILDKRVDKKRIRDFALENFSLQIGIDRYQDVYRSLSLD